MSTDNQLRLGVLTRDLPNVSALLLQSIAGTHRDVFEFGELKEVIQHGVRTVSGEFLHRPTDRRYIVAVCTIPADEVGHEAKPKGY